MIEILALQEEIGILQADKATCLAEIERLTNENAKLNAKVASLTLYAERLNGLLWKSLTDQIIDEVRR